MASQRETYRRKASLEGRAKIRSFVTCNDTAAGITDRACGHRPICFLTSTSGSQDASRASSQKRKLVLHSMEEQRHIGTATITPDTASAGRGDPMKKIFVAMVFAFAFATGMAIVTVIAQID